MNKSSFSRNLASNQNVVVKNYLFSSSDEISKITEDTFSLDSELDFDDIAQNKIVSNLNENKIQSLFVQGKYYNISLLKTIINYCTSLRNLYVFFEDVSLFTQTNVQRSIDVKSFFNDIYDSLLKRKINLTICFALLDNEHQKFRSNTLSKVLNTYTHTTSSFIFQLLFINCEDNIIETILRKGLGLYNKSKVKITKVSDVESIQRYTVESKFKKDKKIYVVESKIPIGFDYFLSNDFIKIAKREFFVNISSLNRAMLLFEEKN